eukprot:1460_1
MTNVQKLPNYHHTEVSIANNISARLMVTRTNTSPFIYRVKFKFKIDLQYKQRHKIANKYTKYDQFIQDFHEDTAINATANVNQPSTIEVHFVSLTASQVLNVYERTVGTINLTQNINSKYNFDIEKIGSSSKKLQILSNHPESDQSKVSDLLNDLKLSIQNFQNEYEKKCRLDIHIHDNKSSSDNRPNKRRQNLDSITTYPPSKVHIGHNENENVPEQPIITVQSSISHPLQDNINMTNISAVQQNPYANSNNATPQMTVRSNQQNSIQLTSNNFLTLLSGVNNLQTSLNNMQTLQKQMSQTIHNNTDNTLVWQSMQELISVRQQLLKFQEKDNQNQKVIARQRKQI